jgi:cysteinyl-tRNA synthetase
MLMTHYRLPIDYSRSKLKYAQVKLDSWQSSVSDWLGVPKSELPKPSKITVDALCDDLNVHSALVHIDELDALDTPESKRQIIADLLFLGIDLVRFWDRHRSLAGVAPNEEYVQELVDARNAARKAKDFKESDRIRDELAAMGVMLKDSKDGTTWEIAR